MRLYRVPGLIVISVVLMMASVGVAAAAAKFWIGQYHVGGGGGGCSNALDFSQACNSQYIPVVFR